MKKQQEYNNTEVSANVKDEPRAEDKRETPDQTHMRVGSSVWLASSDIPRNQEDVYASTPSAQEAIRPSCQKENSIQSHNHIQDKQESASSPVQSQFQGDKKSQSRGYQGVFDGSYVEKIMQCADGKMRLHLSNDNTILLALKEFNAWFAGQIPEGKGRGGVSWANVKDEPRAEDKRETPDQTHMHVGSGGLLGSSVNSANTHYVKLKKGQRVPLLFTSVQKLLAHYNSMSKEELSVFELKLRPTPEESPLPFPDKPLEQ